MLTLIEIQKNPTIAAMIEAANKYLEAIGYTDHGPKHVGYVSRITADILRQLDYPERTVELGAIAGWVHDVGNMINRKNHGITGATMLLPILLEAGMDPEEAAIICMAVGNHEEEHGSPVNEVSAALIIADKIDAHRTRVRRNKYDPTDIHDRVNYAIKKTQVTVDKDKRIIKFACTMDGTSSMKEFLEIYMSRMNLAADSAHFLGCRFELWINDIHVNKVPNVLEGENGR
ncbi:HD domain-containing protein [Eubacteriales bacterium OttesenSCG-928-M02]|nr:HD domain-containing protein [Eubacteriales bacterium OttesenSCG-928-M02]